MFYFRIILLSILFLFVSNAVALDLLDAYEKGVKKDPTYISSLASYRGIVEKIPQAQAAFKPTINWVSNGNISANALRNRVTNGDTSILSQYIQTQSKNSNNSVLNSSSSSSSSTSSTTSTSTSTSNIANSTDVSTASLSNTYSEINSNSNQNSIQNTDLNGWLDSSQTTKNASVSTGLVFSMPLYRPLLNEQLNQSKLLVRQAEVQLLAARQDLALRISQAFFEVVIANENLISVNSQHKVTKEQFDLASKLYASGVTTITDVHEAQARLDILDAQDITAQNDIKLKLFNLKSIIGPFETPILSLKNNGLKLPSPSPSQIDYWIDLAKRNAYISQKQQLGIEIAQSEVDKQYAIYKPTLELTGNIGFSREYVSTQGNKFGGNSQSSSNQSQIDTLTQTNTNSSAITSTGTNASSSSVTTSSTGVSSTSPVNTTASNAISSNSTGSTATNNQSSNNYVSNNTQNVTSTPKYWNRNNTKDFKAAVGVQLVVPIYDGGLNDSRMRESLASLDKAYSDMEKAYADSILTTQQAYVGAVGSLAQVKAFETAEKSSTLAMNANNMGYQLGVRINIDVLNARQQLVLIQRDLNRSRVDVIINYLKLKASVGQLVEQDILQANMVLEK